MVKIQTVYKHHVTLPAISSFFFFVILELLFLRPIFWGWAIFLGFNAVLFHMLYKNYRAVVLPTIFLGSIWGGTAFFASLEGFLPRQILISIFTLIYFLIHFDFRVFHRNDISRKDAFYLLNFIVLLLWVNSLLILSDLTALPDILIIFLASIGCGLLGMNVFYLREEKTILSLVFALVGGEIFWLISFWPFFYLTSAGVFVILIYTLWKIGTEYLEHGLRVSLFLRILGFSALLITVLFVLTPWFPL